MKATLVVLTAGLTIAALFPGCSDPGSTGIPGITTRSHEPGPPPPFPIPTRDTSVAGSGATFPRPLLETWGLQYAYDHPTVQVSYSAGGSGKGITDITNKDVVFAGSDAPMSQTEKSKATTVLHIPETLGLVGVVYNVDGVPNGLKLTGDVVGKVFSGAIKKWNDQAIAALNPGVTLPGTTITIVYRSDSSGTTFAFTDFLTRTSADWATTMGATASKKPDWTKSTAAQLSGNGNDGVGSTIKNNKNTMGYVELAFIHSLGLSAGMIKTKAGEFAAPTTEGAAACAANAGVVLPAANGDWSTISISDCPGEGVYPISTFSYVLVHNSLSAYGGKYSADQLNAFRGWLWWGIHDGQYYGPPLGYAQLPANVVKIGEDALNSMQV